MADLHSSIMDASDQVAQGQHVCNCPQEVVGVVALRLLPESDGDADADGEADEADQEEDPRPLPGEAGTHRRDLTAMGASGEGLCLGVEDEGLVAMAASDAAVGGGGTARRIRGETVDRGEVDDPLAV